MSQQRVSGRASTGERGGEQVGAVRKEGRATGAVLSSADPGLAAALAAALRQLPHITGLAVLRRLNRAAGRRDWYLLMDTAQLPGVLAAGRPGDAFTFFLRPQLRLRGTLDDDLAVQLLSLWSRLPPGYRDELVAAVQLADQPLLVDAEGFAAEDGADLAAWLDKHTGQWVVAGRHPPLLDPAPGETLTVYVPDEHGVVEPGIY